MTRPEAPTRISSTGRRPGPCAVDPHAGAHAGPAPARGVCAAAALWLSAAGAAAQPVVAEGNYTAGTAQLAVKVGTWGDDCGPRPTNRTEPGGAARVASTGGALQIALPDRTLRSDACWTPNPAVRVVQGQRDASGFRVECKTPPSDAKQESGRYAISVRPDGAITLTDDSSYDWQLKTSHCVASVRRTQSLTPGARAAAEPNEPARLDDDARACTPGAATRLRLRPGEARVAPGQRVCFQLQALDGQGCALPAAPAHGPLTLAGSTGAARGETNGLCFVADARTAVSGGSVRLRVEAGALRAEANVRVSAPDLSAITLGEESADAADPATGPATDSVFDAGVRAVVAGTGGHPLLAALLLAAAVALIVLGVRRRQRSPAPSDGDVPARVRKESVAAPTTGEPWVCPRCRRGYPAGTARCTADGEAPIPYAAFRARADQVPGATSKCTACGASLAPGSAFCGVCGRPQGG